MSDRICVGAIGGAFGVKGEVRLKSFCAIPDAIAQYAPLTTEDNPDGYSVTILRPVKNGFAVRLSGVTTKEQADALRGVQLFALRDQLPNLPDDEYYHNDLVGMEVFDTGGQRLGVVNNVMNHGAADLLEIQDPCLKDTVLLPFTLAVVPTVDLTSGRIIVDPPMGVFPDKSDDLVEDSEGVTSQKPEP